MYAVSRLMLDGWIGNLQASWVKQGPELAQVCLGAGANDFGGALMNESISTAAGAAHGQFLTPAQIRSYIRGAGRTPVERSSTYKVLREFENEADSADDSAWSCERFGSYSSLTASGAFRFRDARSYRN